MSTLQLEAEPREIVGQKVKRLRREGLVPVVVYGNVDSNVNLQLSARSLERALQGGGSSQVMQLKVSDGTVHNVLLRDLQRHPVRRNFMHADFYAVNMSEKQVVSVSIVSVNDPVALTSEMMVLQPLDAVEIEALPTDIPAVIEVDITELSLENTFTVADMPALEGVEYITDESEAIFVMNMLRTAEEEVIAEEGVVEGEEGEEGEGEGAEDAGGDEE